MSRKNALRPAVVRARACVLGSGMFGFLIKKAFFDMWDNLLKIVILNLGFILLLALVGFSLIHLTQSLLYFILLGLGLGLVGLAKRKI